MKRQCPLRALLPSLLLFSTPAQSASLQFTQQGPMLVGSPYAAANPAEGSSVAISSDGNTAIIGSPGEVNPSTSAQTGAVWIFTRSNGVWSQQGGELVGTGAPGDARQGSSVALSADGNTAIVGGPADDATTGAAWVFARTNGAWAQQGTKLVGNGAIGLAQQGRSVSLSSDGNTAIVGGNVDNNGTGAAWIFTRANGIWAQQSKLVGMNSSGQGQGFSVAMSGDGNTAIVGTQRNDGAWVFTNSGGVWAQQGGTLSFGFSVALSSDGSTALVGNPELTETGGGGVIFTRSGGVWSQGPTLIGTGTSGGPAYQGSSVSLSADGNTAIVGGTGDETGVGAVWAFQNRGGVWSQLGSKLIGGGYVGIPNQGASVALSTDASTLIEGGPGAIQSVGAAWVFDSTDISAAGTHDFNADGKSDILWRNKNSFAVSVWFMNASQALDSVGLGAVPSEWSIVGQRDFDGDGYADLLWRDTSGDAAIWLLNTGQVASAEALGSVPISWSVVGTGDFNDDGKGDILWRNTGGDTAIWLMNGTQVLLSAGVGNIPAAWSVVGIGDFDGNGSADILWRDTSGDTAIWFMNGAQIASAAGVANIPNSWSVVGTGDFNGDGKSDIAWSDSSGNMAIWLMNGALVTSSAGLGSVPTTWTMVETGDFDGDGKSDLLWRDTSGNTAIWFMNGAQIASAAGVGNIPTVWTIQSANAD
jgi:hypothetical protein